VFLLLSPLFLLCVIFLLFFRDTDLRGTNRNAVNSIHSFRNIPLRITTVRDGVKSKRACGRTVVDGRVSLYFSISEAVPGNVGKCPNAL